MGAAAAAALVEAAAAAVPVQFRLVVWIPPALFDAIVACVHQR